MRASVGMWLWQVAKCEDGDAEAIVDRCRETGLGHVLVKTHDGMREYNGDLAPLVEALRAAGVHVWAWTYAYPRSAEAQAEAFARRARALGVQGLCVDAEVEFKGRHQAASQYMDALDRAAGALPIAVSSYYLPLNHPTFPWHEFLSRADYAMPQVYWFRRDPARCLEQAYDQYGRYIRRGRIIPAGAAYAEGTGEAATIGTFLAACERLGAFQVNFWSWQHATVEMWARIAPEVVV